MSPSEDNPLEMQIELVLAEYMQKCDSGNIPDRDTFLSQHPDLRSQLLELLTAADWIEELAGPRIGQLAADDDGRIANVEDTLPHAGLDEQRSLASDGTVLDSNYNALADSAPTGPARELTQPVLPCQFGDYRLERVLGRGGMGVVYYGRQIQLDRPVAIKMIRSGALASDEEVQRFYAEARSAAKLDHPNIVTVYQCGEFEGHRFFSMDYVPGTDLSRMVADGPIDPKKAARYVRDTARAIQYAHARGILHRDLKPANVLVDEQDQVHITDFGLAKSIGNETGLTATGAALGTPSYMSPEQAAGKVSEQHHATDIYSLGAILYTIVSGHPPFKAGTVVQTIMQVIHRPVPALRHVNPNAPADIETIADVCMQKSPERRYASAGELADDLDRFLSGLPIKARPVPPLRRVWYWLLGVPIIGAILDHRVVEPTEAHRWVQRGLISLGVLMLSAWMMLLVGNSLYRNRMPKIVRFAAGVEGGTYSKVAEQICDALAKNEKCEAFAIRTAGSSENVDRLARGEVEFALIQADALGASTIAVVAPLYYEAVHIFVRNGLEINSLNELRGKRVVVGPNKAGARGTAELLLQNVGLGLDDIAVDTADWHTLQTVPDADAAIVVSKLGSDDVTGLLCAGNYHLMAIPNAWQFALDEPSFRPMLVDGKDYPNCQLPDAGIATLATTAFLAARIETSDILVQTVLHHLFDPSVVAATGIVSAERAAHWQNVAWHPAAREFFHPYRGAKPAANAN